MIPNPSAFRRWELWARQLQQVLTPFMARVDSAFMRQGQVLNLARYSVARLPDAAIPGCLIHVSDERGGAVVAFSDGTHWRRVTDRAVVE